VPLVEGEPLRLAVENVEKEGLKARVIRAPSQTEPRGFVFDQDPDAGARIDRGNVVKLFVSTGKPTTTVPDVRGDSATDAVAELKDAKLEPKIFYRNSSAEEGTVTGQDPKPGEVVVQGTSVRINVSKGPQPVTVPDVERLPYTEALSQLQGEGFAVARQDVESNEPKDSVIDQNPAGNTQAPPGSTVTLYVSKGPEEVEVPDVAGLTRKEGARALRDAGFRISAEIQETENDFDEGIVLSQDPAGGTAAPVNSVVTIVVGRFVPPTQTVPTETVPTETVPTETTATETVPTTTQPPPP
jgi:beta-lactam-binding protein with PASTA domain